MIIQLDLESDVPIYMQLKNRIIEGIAKKELVPGEALPSVRAMAKDLGVNMQTVNKTYQLLKQDGFILIHRQKGVVIHPDGFPWADAAFKKKLEQTFEPLVAEAICRGMDEQQLLGLCKKLYSRYEK